MDYTIQLDLNNGWKLRHIESIDSTNTELSRLCAIEDIPEGMVLSTNHQESGKGRLGRSWIDEPGDSLLFSILCRPGVPLDDYFYATMAMSISACEVLQDYGVVAEIKWPNDILVGGAKLSGMLSEVGESKSGRFMIIGMGINVNQDHSRLEVLKRNATSMAILTGNQLDLSMRLLLASRIVEAFAGRYLPMSQGDPAPKVQILRQYRSRCVTIGSFVRVELNDGESISGNVLDISNQGHLLVELDSCIRTVQAGDVHHVFRSS
ncbi:MULTISPECIES: biotin--[acetyl-CoA-carboxylase] ligase [Acidithrix]|uniref:biotin--[biotin carboxyl-carrier protein] ligase n=1 Tax=Acidithrix ferrooxidans TaxID=1280514 RepID=A0A0D8HK83_9ACTN|nr:MULTISPECIES: biotin--[acetyl-CoA-carboxylase] ligase [Acidithrix]KJF18355.1 bifunctional ligase/repressor BirA [Acidithrix ferrooxidans]CAG4920934.1 unnamed protein product [Acidithrix sp. C25]